MTATENTPDQTVTPAAEPHDNASSEASLVARILLCLFFFIAAWGGAVVTWGLPGLYLPAVALVPVLWAALLLISRG